MTYTVAQLAERYGVGEHTVLAWIRLGELAAVDVSRTTGGRPRWRIAAEAVQAFEAARAAAPPAQPSRRRRPRPGDVVVYY